jgi:hypothetical protein
MASVVVSRVFRTFKEETVEVCRAEEVDVAKENAETEQGRNP